MNNINYNIAACMYGDYNDKKAIFDLEPHEPWMAPFLLLITPIGMIHYFCMMVHYNVPLFDNDTFIFIVVGHSIPFQWPF